MKMTATVSHVTPGALFQALGAPFKAVGNMMVTLMEAEPRLAEIRRLNAMGDDELIARGLTREAEVRRIFAAWV